MLDQRNMDYQCLFNVHDQVDARFFAPFVVVWVSLHGLPFYMFHVDMLHAISNVIGHTLKVKSSTTNLTRPSVVRVYVEVNLLNPLLQRIWLRTKYDFFFQSITYDNLPSYCSSCWKIGQAFQSCCLSTAEGVANPNPSQLEIANPNPSLK